MPAVTMGSSHDGSRLRHGIGGAIAVAILTQSCLVLSGILVARYLGVTNRGYLALFLVAVAIISQLGSLGIPHAIPYYLSSNYRRFSTELEREILLSVTAQIILLTFAYVFVVELLSREATAEVRLAALLASPAIAGYLLFNYGLAFIQGSRCYSRFNSFRLAAPLSYVCAVSILGGLGLRSLPWVTVTWSLSQLGIGCLAALSARRPYRALQRSTDASETSGRETNFRSLVGFGLRAFLGASSPGETLRIDQAVIGIFLSTASLGLYSVAVGASNLPRFLAQNVGMILYPHIASLSPWHRLKQSRRLFLVSAVGLVSATLVLILLTPVIIPTLYGTAFRFAVLPTQILLLGAALTGARRIAGDLLRGCGRPNPSSIAEIIALSAVPLAVVLAANGRSPSAVAASVAVGALLSLIYLLFVMYDVNAQLGRLPGRSAVLCAITIVASIAAGWTISRLSLIAGLVSILALVLVGGLAWRRTSLRNRLDPFDPLLWFVAAWCVMFVVRPIAMIRDGTSAISPGVGRPVLIAETFGRALLLALLFASFFIVSYLFRRPNNVRPSKEVMYPHRVGVVLVLAWVYLVIGAVFVLLAFRFASGPDTGGLLSGRSTAVAETMRNTSGYVWTGAFILIPAFFLGRYIRITYHLLSGLVVQYLSLFLLLLRAIPLGNRMILFPVATGLLVSAYAIRGKRPRFVAILGFALVALTLSSAFLSYRLPDAGSSTSPVSAIAEPLVDPGLLVEPLTQGNDAAMAPLLAAALTVVPERTGTLYGQAIVGDLLYRPVPRSLWPAKPLPPREVVVGELWPGSIRGAQIASPEFSTLLYFYLDLGLVGVALGGILFGLGARAVFEGFAANQRSLATASLYGVFLALFVTGLRDSPVDSLIRMGFGLLPLLFALAVSSRWQRTGVPNGVRT